MIWLAHLPHALAALWVIVMTGGVIAAPATLASFFGLVP